MSADGPSPELSAAIAEHRQLLATRPEPTPERRAPRGSERPGDPDRSAELHGRPGWSWLRVFRRYDDYQRALDLLESMPTETAGEAELERVP